MNKTFEECAEDKPQTIYFDRTFNDVRLIVMRGPGCVNGYVGVKENHPYFGKSYDDTNIDCHGGLTYANMGDDKYGWPSDYYWFGWDYAHLGDKTFYDLNDRWGLSGEHGWTPAEVLAEGLDVVEQFEAIQNEVK